MSFFMYCCKNCQREVTLDIRDRYCTYCGYNYYWIDGPEELNLKFSGPKFKRDEKDERT